MSVLAGARADGRPRRGPTRHAARRAAHALGRGLLALGVALFAAWAVSRLATDRWTWSQYPWWVPTELWTVGVACVLALGAGLVRLGAPSIRTTARSARRRRGRVPRWPAVLLLIMLAHVLLARWRLPNAMTRAPASATPSAVRVLAWNVNDLWLTENIEQALFAQPRDLVLLSNTYNVPDWSAIARRFLDQWPADAADRAAPSDAAAGGPWDDPRVLRDFPFLVLSRWPVLRHRRAWSTPHDPPPDGVVRRLDLAQVLALELDTRAELGRPMVVWLVDLPSNPRLPRAAVTRRLALAVAATIGASGPQGDAFPPPDLIAGDFNIPRGSASLRTLVGDRTDAFDAAGLGYAASFPLAHPHTSGVGQFADALWAWWITHIGVPVLHIDLMFAGPALRTVRYELLRATAGFHSPQAAEFVIAEASREIATPHDPAHKAPARDAPQRGRAAP